MPTGAKSRSKDSLVQNPGQVGNALANIVSLEGGREVVLGQAWLAAPNRLITCGHVVERYVNAPSLLYCRFPASGNKYQVLRVRLHPSFVRQPDQLVKFDVALLELSLQPPEAMARPLPFSYEQEFTTNQTLWAIRYPAHLGQLSAAPHPLTQDGRFLGPLRMHDKFHLLHDLPLSPGDSGAPISDGKHIVAIHCGDTATLPGLNLPTTSIRLALWVDALRELGISETVHTVPESERSSILPTFLAFILAAALAGFGAWTYFGAEAKKEWTYDNPSIMPLKVGFNKSVDGYENNEDVKITITPASKCYLVAFSVTQQDQVAVLYPQYGLESEMLNPGEQRIINKFGYTKLTASPDKDMVYVVAVKGSSSKAEELVKEIITAKDWQPKAEEGKPLLIKGSELLNRIKRLKDENGDDIMFMGFVGPHSKGGGKASAPPAPAAATASATPASAPAETAPANP